MNLLVFVLSLAYCQNTVWLPDRTHTNMYSGRITGLTRRLRTRIDEYFYEEYWKAIGMTTGDRVTLTEIESFYAQLLEKSLEQGSPLRDTLEFELRSFFADLEYTRFDRDMNYYKFKLFIARLHLAYSLAIVDLCDRDDDDYVDMNETPCMDWTELVFEFSTGGSLLERDSPAEKILRTKWEFIAGSNLNELEADMSSEQVTETGDIAVDLAASTLQGVPLLNSILNVGPAAFKKDADGAEKRKVKEAVTWLKL